MEEDSQPTVPSNLTKYVTTVTTADPDVEVLLANHENNANNELEEVNSETDLEDDEEENDPLDEEEDDDEEEEAEEKGGEEKNENNENNASMAQNLNNKGKNKGEKKGKSDDESGKGKGKGKKDKNVKSDSDSVPSSGKRSDKDKARKPKKRTSKDYPNPSKDAMFDTEQYYVSCFDHEKTHGFDDFTPNLVKTVAEMIKNPEGAQFKSIARKLESAEGVCNPCMKEINKANLPSVFNDLAPPPPPAPPAENTEDTEETKEEPEAAKKNTFKVYQLLYQTAFDLELLSSSEKLTPFLGNMFKSHAELLVQCKPYLKENVAKKWDKMSITEGLQLALNNLCIDWRIRHRELCATLSKDLLVLLKIVFKKKVSDCWRFKKCFGIRTLYHSFIVPNRHEYQVPFLRLDNDKRVYRTELTCHCRISVTETLPPCALLGSMFVEMYFDFIYGNPLGAMDMLQRMIYENLSKGRIPVQDYRTMICFPSGEKLVFKDLHWMRRTVPLKFKPLLGGTYFQYSSTQGKLEKTKSDEDPEERKRGKDSGKNEKQKQKK